MHVMGIHRELTARGIPCLVLDPGRGRSKFGLTKTVLRYASEGWTIHLHTNGHNPKSWLLVMFCGAAGRLRGNPPILTLHSGMAPGYLRGGVARRKMAAAACGFYGRIVCVSAAIQEAVKGLGVAPAKTEIAPACLGAARPGAAVDAGLVSWIERHEPVFSTTLSFRPEYGFPALVAGLAKLRQRHPRAGCLVMGTGEEREEAESRIREAHLEENILLVGDVDHEVCLSLMSRSDVFLRPTLEDGDSISVREALALGVPVVASRVGTRPEGAILFEPGNVDDMLGKLEVAMSRPAGHGGSVESCLGRLLEIYQVMGAERACVST